MALRSYIDGAQIRPESLRAHHFDADERGRLLDGGRACLVARFGEYRPTPLLDCPRCRARLVTHFGRVRCPQVGCRFSYSHRRGGWTRCPVCDRVVASSRADFRQPVPHPFTCPCGVEWLYVQAWGAGASVCFANRGTTPTSALRPLIDDYPHELWINGLFYDAARLAEAGHPTLYNGDAVALVQRLPVTLPGHDLPVAVRMSESPDTF